MASLKQILLILIVLGCGVWGFKYLAKTKPLVEKQAGEVTGQLVESQEVVIAPFVPQVVGYGEVSAHRQWEIRAKVSGTLGKVHEGFAVGRTLKAGVLLARTDPRRSRSRVAELEQRVLEFKHRLGQLEAEKESDERHRELEKRAVALAKDELERWNKLVKNATGSKAKRDQAESQWLAKQTALANRERQLALFPWRKQELRSQERGARHTLEVARQELADTRITAPAEVVVAETRAEKGAFYTPGEVIGSVYDANAMEIRVTLSSSQVRLLSPEDKGRTISAKVYLSGGEEEGFWSGSLSHMEGAFDSAGRQAVAVISVDNSQERNYARPALSPLMFTRVVLEGKTIKGVTPIPRRLLHSKELFVIEEERLASRQVEIKEVVGDLALISSGIKAGEWLLTSPLAAPYAGMPVHHDTSPVMRTQE